MVFRLTIGLIILLVLSSCTRVVYLGYTLGTGIKYGLEGKYYKPPEFDFKILDYLCKNEDDRADVCFKIAQTFQTMKNPKMYEYYDLVIKKGYRTKLSSEELVKYYDDKYANIKEAELDCNFTTRYVFDCYYYNRYSQNYLRCQKVEKTISTYYAKYERLKAEYEELTNPNNPCNQKNADKKDCLSKTYIQSLKNDYKKCENYLRRYGWFLD